MCRKMWVPEQSLSRSRDDGHRNGERFPYLENSHTLGVDQKVNPYCLTPAADAAAPVGHAACTSFQRVSPWLNVHFAHSDTALKRLIRVNPIRVPSMLSGLGHAVVRKRKHLRNLLRSRLLFIISPPHFPTNYGQIWSNCPIFVKRKLQVIENQLLANLFVPRAGIDMLLNSNALRILVYSFIYESKNQF